MQNAMTGISRRGRFFPITIISSRAGNQHSTNLGEFLQKLHYDSACELNRLESQPGRNVWYNFRDTKLTHQYSYLARLNYVHQNAVKHGLVPMGTNTGGVRRHGSNESHRQHK